MTHEEWIKTGTWKEAYAVVVHWIDGGKTIEKTSSSPTEIRGAPTISRNPKVIRRIEIHDFTGCLETLWDVSWK